MSSQDWCKRIYLSPHGWQKKCICTPSHRSPPGSVWLWIRRMNVHPLPNGMRNVSGCSFALISRPDLILEHELGLWLSASQGRVYSDIVSGDKHMTACSPLLDSWGHILIKTSLSLDLNATKKVLFISTDFVKQYDYKIDFPLNILETLLRFPPFAGAIAVHWLLKVRWKEKYPNF